MLHSILLHSGITNANNTVSEANKELLPHFQKLSETTEKSLQSLPHLETYTSERVKNHIYAP